MKIVPENLINIIWHGLADDHMPDHDPILEDNGAYLLFLQKWAVTPNDAKELEADRHTIFSCVRGDKGAFLLSEPPAPEPIIFEGGKTVIISDTEQQEKFLTENFGANLIDQLVEAVKKIVEALSSGDNIQIIQNLNALDADKNEIMKRTAMDLRSLATYLYPRAIAQRPATKEREPQVNEATKDKASEISPEATK